MPVVLDERDEHVTLVLEGGAHQGVLELVAGHQEVDAVGLGVDVQSGAVSAGRVPWVGEEMRCNQHV